MSTLENSPLQPRFASPAARGLLMLLASTLVVGLGSLWLALQSSGWQLWGLVISALIFSGATLIVLGQARRGIGRWAIVTLLALLSLLLFANALWFQHFGRFAAVLLAVLGGLGLYLLGGRRIGAAIGVLAVPVVLLLAADLLLQVPWRVASSPLEAGFLVVDGLLVLVLTIAGFVRLSSLSLRTRTTVILPLIAVVPAALLGFLNAQITRSALTDTANENLLTSATAVADALDGFYATEQQDVRSAALILSALAYFDADAPLGQGPDANPERVAALLSAFRAQDPINIASYAILDETGSVRFTTAVVEEGTVEQDTPYFGDAWSTQRAVATPVLFSAADGRGYIYFATPIIDGAGETRAVLRIKYRAEILQELVSSRTGAMGGESFAVLFDDNLLHLAHGAAPEAIYRLVVPLPAAQFQLQQASLRLPPGDQAQLADNLQGLAGRLRSVSEQPLFEATDLATGDRINQVAVASMAAQPWQVAFFQPQDLLFAPVGVQARNTLLLTAAVSLAMILVALLLSRLLTRPLTTLTQAAARVTAGDLSVRVPVENEDEFGLLATAFNAMTEQLSATLGNLSGMVDERTRALQLSTEVSRRLSHILDADELVAEVVRQVQEAFSYYHVHIYLVERETGRLRMVGGTGKPGELMLARKHTLKQGQGLVGRAAELNFPVLVPDVSLSEAWLANPLLPQTKAEIAVPIVSGGVALGVLDVQHDVVGGLDQDDVNMLQSIANQVGTALRNADSFAAAQQRAEQQARINAISEEIQRTDSAEDALQVAVRELGRALGGVKTTARMKAENGNAADEAFPARVPNGNGTTTSGR